MSPIEIGPRGGSDESPHLTESADHSDILRHATELHSSLSGVIKGALNQAAEDIKQRKSDSIDQLDKALQGIKAIADQLKKDEDLVSREDEKAGGALRQTEQSGQPTREVQEHIQQSYDEACRETNNGIQQRVSDLESALHRLDQVLTETSQWLPGALPAKEYIWRPRELLNAKIVIAQEDIQALRKQLSATASPTDTHSPIADLPLGHVSLKEALKAGNVDKLAATIKLFRRLEQEPDDPVDRQRDLQRRDLLLDTLKNQDGDYHPWIHGDTVLDKLLDLYSQLHTYWDRPTGYAPSGLKFELQAEHQHFLIGMQEVEARLKEVEFALFANPQQLDDLRRPL